MVRHGYCCVYHVGEVVTQADYHLGLRVHTHTLELFPTSGLVIKIEGLDVLLGQAGRDQGFVVGQADSDLVVDHLRGK